MNKPPSRAGWRELRQWSCYHAEFGWFLESSLSQHSLSGSVLDIGCGAMPYRKLFGERVRYEGIDDDHLAGAPEPVTIGDMQQLPFAGSRFSVVLSSFALHQAPSPGRALAEMARVLTSGGKLFLAVPSRAYLLYRMPRWLLPKNFVQRRGISRAELMDLLERNGFLLGRIWGYGGLLAQFFERMLGLCRVLRFRLKGSRTCTKATATIKAPGGNRWVIRLRAVVCGLELLLRLRLLGSGFWAVEATRKAG
ncbi:MAG TPA: class I SAM-dependent methyltransferase [Verrucomicrobiae bacterium]|nr:class I SAM-dependent methyltransferase [Verrucomicrobiae bacterium]